jgi:molecular chaperone HscA
MNLLNIEEEQVNEDSKKVAVGIDLGTSNSLVAYSTKQTAQILADQNGNTILKSIIDIDQKGNITIGKETGNSLHSCKRLMGKILADIDQDLLKYNYNFAAKNNDHVINLKLGNRNINPIEISAEILKALKLRAEKSLGEEVTDAVITVPAYFDDASRQATKDAAALAGLNCLRLLNEPTAAALAYGLDNNVEGYYAIYDFGGGTFDISILKMTKGVFKVIATKGDNFLGGDDIDIAICNYLKSHNQLLDIDNQDNKKLLLLATQIKEYLSFNDNFTKDIIFANQTYQINLTQAEYHKIINPLINKTIDIFNNCLADAQLKIADLQEIILVGGTTKIPYLKEQLYNNFNKKPLDKVNPDTVVAVGSALQAESLTTSSGNLLLDIIPLSLGLETVGGIIEKIIPRNSSIPCSVSQEFTTYKDNQTAMKIHIVQGERELANDNRSLAFFELKNIPILEAGKAKIKIIFNVDTDGILTVTASETTKNILQEIQVKPSYGLDTKQMQEMLNDSYKNAKSDMLQRVLKKNYVQIEQFVDASLNMSEDEALALTNAEKKAIKEKVLIDLENAKNYLEKDNFAALDKLHKELKKYLDDLCIKKVDMITAQLQGKDINDLFC